MRTAVGGPDAQRFVPPADIPPAHRDAWIQLYEHGVTCFGILHVSQSRDVITYFSDVQRKCPMTAWVYRASGTDRLVETEPGFPMERTSAARARAPIPARIANRQGASP